MTRMITVSEDALNSIKAMAEQDAKDAARYRWLRIGDVQQMDVMEDHCGSELDAAIDAAMQTK